MKRRIFAASLAVLMFTSAGLPVNAAARGISNSVQAVDPSQATIIPGFEAPVPASVQEVPTTVSAPVPEIPVTMPVPDLSQIQMPVPAPVQEVPVSPLTPEQIAALLATLNQVPVAVPEMQQEPAPVVDTPETRLYATADGVLAGIINPGMDGIAKSRAIYNWVKKHIKYAHQNNHSDWVAAATTGLTKGRGDCYVYYATSRALLTRAGITNTEIHKVPAKTEHYWNLVNLGGGWLHFDTTPRKDDRSFFLWTESQLMQYSNSHNLSHNYDRNVYTGIVY